jgi:hypothetical protein
MLPVASLGLILGSIKIGGVVTVVSASGGGVWLICASDKTGKRRRMEVYMFGIGFRSVRLRSLMMKMRGCRRESRRDPNKHERFTPLPLPSVEPNQEQRKLTVLYQ